MELHPAAPPATTLLHLDKPRARVLGNGSDDDRIDGWYLDSGATHHMTDGGSSSPTWTPT